MASMSPFIAAKCKGVRTFSLRMDWGHPYLRSASISTAMPDKAAENRVRQAFGFGEDLDLVVASPFAETCGIRRV
jgi:hypothetical protein